MDFITMVLVSHVVTFVPRVFIYLLTHTYTLDDLELTDCCMIRPSRLNFLGGTWKRISLPSDIRDMRSLEASPFHGIALYGSTFTYLLTLFCNSGDCGWWRWQGWQCLRACCRAPIGCSLFDVRSASASIGPVVTLGSSWPASGWRHWRSPLRCWASGDFTPSTSASDRRMSSAFVTRQLLVCYSFF